VKGRLVDTAFQIQDSLRPKLRNKPFRNCLAEKSNSLLDKFCNSLLQISETAFRKFEFPLRDAKPLASSFIRAELAQEVEK
jgi:hypothetical protein